jgi:hypothetical protein
LLPQEKLGSCYLEEVSTLSHFSNMENLVSLTVPATMLAAPGTKPEALIIRFFTADDASWLLVDIFAIFYFNFSFNINY